MPSTDLSTIENHASHHKAMERPDHPSLDDAPSSDLPWSHAARPLVHGSQSASIDLGIYDLIKAAWQLGIKTHNSCENTNQSGLVWVCFSSPSDLTRFIDLASGPEKSAIWTTVRYDTTWTWDLLISMSVTGSEAWLACLQFPRTDIATVTANLEASLTTSGLIS